jgi:hypothetical protein
LSLLPVLREKVRMRVLLDHPQVHIQKSPHLNPLPEYRERR